jgi:peptidoglycan/xylan/chitin deacetylase (PgdA/CDA1 family)
MRHGVPRLLEMLDGVGVRATFYFSMGPDRSGRAALNVFRPGFLSKMRRSGAARVYGWRTILSGTLLPSRPIATALGEIARRTRDLGHETGVHAWDHRSWQDHLLRFAPSRVRDELNRGREAYESVMGAAPRSFAAPAWLSCDDAILHEEGFSLDFGSDCRGREPFFPVIRGRAMTTPQVPTTLPTLDEALGDTHRDAENYFSEMLERPEPGAWHVLAIHAEYEGGTYAAEFRSFLHRAGDRGLSCIPLGELLRRRREAGPLPACPMRHAPVRGRHGVVSMQWTSGEKARQS